MKKLVRLFLIVASLGLNSGWSWLEAQEIIHYSAVELELKGTSERPFFYRPSALVIDGQELYLLETGDNRIQVYNRQGTQLREIGRKGNGPGEFDSPQGLDVFSQQICVADTFNSRIQILDKTGKSLFNFKVPFLPDNIVWLNKELMAISSMTRNLNGPGKMIHGYRADGHQLWAIVDSFASGDRVYDSLSNQIFLRRGLPGIFYVIWKANNRYILKIDWNGQILKKINLSSDYPLKTINLPGKEKRALDVICWNAAWFNQSFYLIAVEETEDQDLGPGKKVLIINEDGKITGMIDFPIVIKKLAVAEDCIYALDTEDELHLFRLKAK
ncbi:MAG: 6-bladed beta-propeller [Acidobacteriota bacterium]|nr:6-bladed beta-propeller [Acidobacteriota bacterium]